MNTRKRLPEGAVILLALAFALLILLVPSADAAGGRYAADKAAAHEAAELLRGMGYGEDNPVIVAAKSWWHETDDAQMAAYPVASEVWTTLRAAGLSEAVTAGIIGNMMAEVGGHTLDLLPDIRCGQYYGLCMWDVGFTPEADGADVQGQLRVLLDTLEYRINEVGGSYEYFLALDDCRHAARYFDRYYERSAGMATGQRAENAAVALAFYGTEG